MKVYIYSQEEIKELFKTNRFPKNVGVIKILNKRHSDGDADDSIPIMELISRTHHVHCLFIDDLKLEEINEQGLTIDTYFPRADRTALSIKIMYKNGCDIVCYSRHGRSRSAAFAAAILEYYNNNGVSILSDNRYSPNEILYKKLLKALREEKHD